MEHLVEIAKHIITTHGYLGIFLLTLAEQFIFPIPAEVFMAIGMANGLLFAKILTIVLIAALLGSTIGYMLGKYLGHPVAVWLFGQKRLDRGEKFINKWGIWGIMIAGFMPFPFKIINWTAGIFEMPFPKYLLGLMLGHIPRYIITAIASTIMIKTKFYASTDMSAIILGILQGATEFLPISSSGHLFVMENFLHLPLSPDEMMAFDIFLHGGSFLAILVYFWKDWFNVIKEIWISLTKFRLSQNDLFVKLTLGTIPAIIAGLLFSKAVEGPLRNLYSIATCFIIIGFFYFYVSWKGLKNKKEDVTLKNAIYIGLAQAIALIPGVSRSGMTISAGMLSGIRRDIAAKFSFMLGAVSILAANVYNIFSIRHGALIPKTPFILFGTITSFIISIACIAFLLRFLQKYTLRPFAFYLILVGILILRFL